VVEALLYELRKKRFQYYGEEQASPEKLNNFVVENLNDVEKYLEQLYQDNFNEKIEASKAIFKLSMQPNNIHSLAQNNQLISALSRLLLDEYKKSSEFTLNICCSFLLLSNFEETHFILSNFRLGATMMRVVDFALNRVLYLRGDYDDQDSKNECSLLSNSISNRMCHSLSDSCSYQNNNSLTMKKQFSIITVGLSFLLNLAEDVDIEKKMTKKSLVNLLCKCLYSNIPGAFSVVLVFLKKISIFEENILYMAKEERLFCEMRKLISSSRTVLTELSIDLLFNMSFNEDARKLMVQHEFISPLVRLFKQSSTNSLTCLLYHISADPHAREVMSNTELPAILMKLIKRASESLLEENLAALAINLSTVLRCADCFCKNGVKYLLKRTKAFNDVLAAKILRNISMWTMRLQQIENKNGCSASFAINDKPNTFSQNVTYQLDIKLRISQHLWTPHVEEIIEMCLLSGNDSLVVELLGILGNLSNESMPSQKNWFGMISRSLIEFLKTKIRFTSNQVDTRMEALAVVYQILGCDEISVNLLAQEEFFDILFNSFQRGVNDTELVRIFLLIFTRMLEYTVTRREVMSVRGLVRDAIKFTESEQIGVCMAANSFLDRMQEFDRDEWGGYGNLGQAIIRDRFKAKNKCVDEIGKLYA